MVKVIISWSRCHSINNVLPVLADQTDALSGAVQMCSQPASWSKWRQKLDVPHHLKQWKSLTGISGSTSLSSIGFRLRFDCTVTDVSWIKPKPFHGREKRALQTTGELA